MPPAKKRVAVPPTADDAGAEEQTEVVGEPATDVSTDTAEVEATDVEVDAETKADAPAAAEPETTVVPAKRAGRWRFWRRGGSASETASAAPEPSQDSVEDTTGATTAAAAEEVASPRPTGKRRRIAAEAAPAVVEAESAEPESIESESAVEPEPVEPESIEPEADAADAAAADEPVVADADGTAVDETVSATEEPAAVVLVPHRQAGKRLKIAAAAAAALFVAAGAFAGAAVQPYLSDRALVDTKQNIAETAAAAINTLWTYTPDDMGALPDRASQYLAGDFATEYRRYIDAIVSTNKQAQISNNTQVMGTAVESVTPDEATAIVYTNSVSTSPVTKNIPSLRYLSYRLIMQREDTRWLITKMTAITQLDLTPRL